MVHENDPQRGGCAFENFFRRTPEDLTNEGLYKTLAIAAYPGNDHRAVSMALIASALGAVPNEAGGALSDASEITRRRASRVWQLAMMRLLAFIKVTAKDSRSRKDTGLLELTVAVPVTMQKV